MTFDGPTGADKLASAILLELERLPEFDGTLMARMRDHLRELATSRKERERDIDRRKQKLERERDNIVAAIREGCYSAALSDELRIIEFDLTELAAERDDLERENVTEFDIPSFEDIKGELREVFTDLAISSPEFQRNVKRLIPQLEFFPYRPVDGGHPVLRASVTLNIGAFLSGSAQLSAATPSLEHRLAVDLFDPPQRIKYRKQVVELCKSMTQRETARKLGLALPAVQAAVSLQRKMDALGTTDPYIPLREPPADYTKLRRHKHRRYRFEPLPGYEDPQFPTM